MRFPILEGARGNGITNLKSEGRQTHMIVIQIKDSPSVFKVAIHTN